MQILEALRVRDVRARLGASLREWRTRRQLTQEQLAERSGLSYKFIGEIERGRGNPTVDTVARLANALNLAIADLFADLDRDRVARGEYQISKRDLQVVREAAESIGALMDHITSPPYTVKRHRRR